MFTLPLPQFYDFTQRHHFVIWLFVICHFLFALCYLSLVLCFLFSYYFCIAICFLGFVLLFTIPLHHICHLKLGNWFFSMKPIEDTFQGKNMNCGQLLQLRITQPMPWWLPFRGNQTLIQMAGPESGLLSFYVNRNVVGNVNKGIPLLPIQSNTIQVNNSILIFKNNCA